MMRRSISRSKAKTLGLSLARTRRGGVALDPDAVAYASTTGLTGDPLDRLSASLKEIKVAGINLVFGSLGRSEFLGRDGSTHHHLISAPATISGTLGNTAQGILFDGGAGNVYEFPNPAPFTSGYVWQLAVAIPAANDAQYALVSGSPNSGGPFGPALQRNNGNLISFWGGNAPTGTTNRARSHAYGRTAVGVPFLAMGQRTGAHVQPIKDIYAEFALSETNPIWNNGSVWRLGAQTTNNNRMVGHIALALAGTGVLTREQIYRMAASIVRHNLAGINPPCWMGFVGDSMTVSASGGAQPSIGRSARWVSQSSGWQGSFYDLIAVGGTSITGQEGFFNTMMTLMAWVQDMPRKIVFWGGYNAIEPFGFATQAGAEALADRYLAMAATAAAAGIETVHWSRTVEGDNARGNTTYNNIQHFNDYYRDQLALLPGNHIYYDHRLSFPNTPENAGNHFDGTERNPLFFGDNIHCSQLGIDTLVDDFLMRFPNP